MPGNPSGTAPGGGATPPAAADGTWLTLTPATVTLKHYEGETTRFTINAKSSRTFEKPFNAAIVDSQGVVKPQVSLSKQSDVEYILGLQTAALPAGTHTTRLQLRLCEDDPAICSKPLPGSPWSVPVTVEVAPATQAQQRMTFTPAAVDLTTYVGEPTSMLLGIKANTSFDVPIRIAVSGGDGVIVPDAAVSQSGLGQYQAKLTTASGLAQGEHTTSLEVRVCYDDPRECKSPVIGSPWRVPVKVTVKPGTNLTTLAPIPALAPWSTYNGNPAHTGYVPASFSPAAFSRRWSMPESAAGPVSAPAIDNGKLFAVRGNMFGTRELVAIDEGSGQVAWRYDLGVFSDVKPPAAADGKVYVSAGGNYIMSWVFDQATGRMLGNKMMSAMSDCKHAPTAAGGMFYGSASSYEGIHQFNPTTNAIAWTNLTVAKGNPCPPSVVGSLAYGYNPTEVYALNTADGSVAYTIPVPGGWAQGSTSAPLVVGGGMGFVTDGTRLQGFDLGARTRAWVVEGKPVGQPVLANGILYSLAEDGMTVEARAAATGVLQWKSAGLTNWSLFSPYERLAVTSNLLFISGPYVTVAIDLATQQVVWSYPLGGQLAISDRGVLYIVAASGKLAAINLR